MESFCTYMDNEDSDCEYILTSYDVWNEAEKNDEEVDDNEVNDAANTDPELTSSSDDKNTASETAMIVQQNDDSSNNPLVEMTNLAEHYTVGKNQIEINPLVEMTNLAEHYAAGNNQIEINPRVEMTNPAEHYTVGNKKIEIIVSTKRPCSWINQPVEQLCPLTGKVLECFPTAMEALKTVKISGKPTISTKYFGEILRGRMKPPRPRGVYRGYFWRYAGSNSLPDHHELMARFESCIRTYPVEQLCLKTGKVLKQFATAEEAHKSVADDPTSFSEFSEELRGLPRGNKGIYKGYLWRFSKPDPCPDLTKSNLPGGRFRYRPVEQLCPLSEKVLNRFETAWEAQICISHPQKFEAFRRVLKGRYMGNSRIYKGFFWRLAGTDYTPQNPGTRELISHNNDDESD